MSHCAPFNSRMAECTEWQQHFHFLQCVAAAFTPHIDGRGIWNKACACNLHNWNSSVFSLFLQSLNNTFSKNSGCKSKVATIDLFDWSPESEQTLGSPVAWTVNLPSLSSLHLINFFSLINAFLLSANFFLHQPHFPFLPLFNFLLFFPRCGTILSEPPEFSWTSKLVLQFYWSQKAHVRHGSLLSISASWECATAFYLWVLVEPCPFKIR